jgi:hypothetical protein
MTDDMTVEIDSEEYVLRPDGDSLQVGRRNGGAVTWLDAVDLGLLPAPAREALERGDTANAELLIALRGVTTAEVERGG